MNITNKSQAINTSTSTLKNTECMLVSQMTRGPAVCVYVSPCDRAEILHKHYHQSFFSEENEHSMSLCLGLYHSLATNGHWAKLQKKNKDDIYFGSLSKQGLSLLWYLAHCQHLQIKINNSNSDIQFWQNVLNTYLKWIN